MADRIQAQNEAFTGVDKAFVDKTLAKKREVKVGRSCLLNKSDPNYAARRAKKRIKFILPERQKTIFDTATLTLSDHFRLTLHKVKNTNLEDESADQATYQLVIDANALLAEIDYEVNKIYGLFLMKKKILRKQLFDIAQFLQKN